MGKVIDNSPEIGYHDAVKRVCKNQKNGQRLSCKVSSSSASERESATNHSFWEKNDKQYSFYLIYDFSPWLLGLLGPKSTKDTRN